MHSLTPEQIEKVFSTLNDSVNIIDLDVDANEHSEEIDKRVYRNWKHIEIMLEKDFVKNQGIDLSIYANAVSKGKSFIGDINQ